MSTKIIYNPKEISGGFANGYVLALGNYDGFHLGHKAIIAKARAIADQKGLKLGVISFEPHPITLFKPEKLPIRLNTLRDKVCQLEEAGVDSLIILRFNKSFSEISAHDFIARYLQGNHVVTGFNFAFGYKRQGNTELLQKELGENYTMIDPAKNGEVIYSSSVVRHAIKDGNVRLATQILGHRYFISGKVIKGAGKGSQLGFATANIKLRPELMRPKYGVYAVKTNYGFGVANFGVRPTIDGKTELLEVHLFDFEKDIYGKALKIEFIDYLREEKQFNNIDELIKQISADKIKAKELCSKEA